MIRELRDPELARDWLAAGLAAVRVGAPGGASVRDGTPWIRAAAEGPWLPPPGFLVDLGRLLLAPLAPPRAGPGFDDRVLRTYEDQVVGRLGADALRPVAADALRALPRELQPAGIALLAELLLARIGFDAGVVVEPGALRALDETPEEDWVVRGAGASRGPAGAALREGYAVLIERFQRTGRALDAAEIGVLEQLPVLRSRSERLALRQVLDASAALLVGLPARLRSTRRRAGPVATRLEDESAYPVGGFAAISTTGTPENLVPSELATMEDGDDLDLFDVRYVAGELLYYTRDETAHTRGRRRVAFALDAELDAARVRDAGVPWQRLVMALGTVHALVGVLIRQLRSEDLRIAILVDPSLEAEARLLRLALADAVASGVATVEVGPPVALAEAFAAASRSAPTDLVTLAVRPPAEGTSLEVTARSLEAWRDEGVRVASELV